MVDLVEGDRIEFFAYDTRQRRQSSSTLRRRLGTAVETVLLIGTIIAIWISDTMVLLGAIIAAFRD